MPEVDQHVGGRASKGGAYRHSEPEKGRYDRGERVTQFKRKLRDQKHCIIVPDRPEIEIIVRFGKASNSN